MLAMSTSRVDPSPLAGEGGRRRRSDDGSRRPVRLPFYQSAKPDNLTPYIDPSSVAPDQVRGDTFSRKGRRAQSGA
jgi:hypothetical protein